MLSGLAAVSLALGRAAGFWPLHPLIELAVLITCLSGAVCNMSRTREGVPMPGFASAFQRPDGRFRLHSVCLLMSRRPTSMVG
jgi:hypothetical protein